MATKLTLLLVLALAGLALHAHGADASSLDAPDERMDIIEDTTAVSTTTDAPPHGRNLLSTPCRRRRSAAWLASHPRKTGLKEAHHDRPRLPWCDEVDIEVVVAAAVESTPTPAAPVSSYNHCGLCKFSRSGDTFTALEQTTCTVPAGTEQCTVPVGSPNAGDICWNGENEFMGANECWITSVNYCAEDCTNKDGASGNTPVLAPGETCEAEVTNSYRCVTEDGETCYKAGSGPGSFNGCRDRD